MKPTWIVVSSNRCARIFTTQTQSSPLIEVEVLTHPEGRLHDRDLTSDLPGKIKGAEGHAFEQATNPKQVEAERFARTVANHLEAARNAHQFDHLLLVAEPSFLGLLRNLLPASTRNLIRFELDSNFTSLSTSDIRTRLPKYLPVQ